MWTDTNTAALLMMICALPTMFFVIGIFIVITDLLVKAFPAEEE
jgi:hypothetical protein